MLPTSHLLAFALTAIVLIAVPGPSVLFVIGRSLALGKRGGLLSAVGNELGMLPQVAAVALGVGAIVARSIAAFTTVKLLGAAYLVYLGIKAIRERNESTGSLEETVQRHSTSKLVREGFLVGLTNPKSIVFFVAVLPQFVDYTRGQVPAQMALLGLVFVAIALVSDSVWAIAAGTARDWFARNPRRISHLRAGGGTMMILLGGTLALAGNQR